MAKKIGPKPRICTLEYHGNVFVGDVLRTVNTGHDRKTAPPSETDQKRVGLGGGHGSGYAGSRLVALWSGSDVYPATWLHTCLVRVSP